MKKIKLCILPIFLLLTSCNTTHVTEVYKEVNYLNKNEQVTIDISIPFEIDAGFNYVSNEFMKRNPNVNVQLEYVNDYDTNAMKKFIQNDTDIILQRDTIYSNNITFNDTKTGEKITKTTDELFYNFYEEKEIDLSSNTTDKFMANYMHTYIDENNISKDYLYSIPLGGEMRGIFVNKTLLKHNDLTVPKNWNEFLNCCEVLKSKGYIPIQGAAASAGLGLETASLVNSAIHDENKKEALKNANEGVSEYFRDSLNQLYSLNTNFYMNYKKLESMGIFDNSADIAQARNFLGLKLNNQYGYDKPVNNYGNVAFFPYLNYASNIISKLIDDYGLNTEYEFITTPTSINGENPVYLTPYYGMCLNKRSKHLDWLREFVNFFYNYKNMCKTYSDYAGIVPNNKDLVSYVKNKYKVKSDNAIAFSGDIYFSSDYNMFSVISSTMTNVSKCNALKYLLKADKDSSGKIIYQNDNDGLGNYLFINDGKSTKVYEKYVGDTVSLEYDETDTEGNIITKYGDFAFCNIDYYLNQLEQNFAKKRK